MFIPNKTHFKIKFFSQKKIVYKSIYMYNIISMYALLICMYIFEVTTLYPTTMNSAISFFVLFISTSFIAHKQSWGKISKYIYNFFLIFSFSHFECTNIYSTRKQNDKKDQGMYIWNGKLEMMNKLLEKSIWFLLVVILKIIEVTVYNDNDLPTDVISMQREGSKMVY